MSLNLTQEVVALIKGNIKVKKETKKYIKYKVLPIYYPIQDEFIRVSLPTFTKNMLIYKQNKGREYFFTKFLKHKPAHQLYFIYIREFRKIALKSNKGYCLN